MKKILFFLFLITYQQLICQTVINGDFSSGNFPWVKPGCIPEIRNQSVYGGPSGTNLVCEIDVKANACQTVSGFTIGCAYTISFDCTRRNHFRDTTSKSMSVIIDGGALNTIVNRPSNSPFLFVQENFTFIATNTTHSISFRGISTSSFITTIGLIIDNITLSNSFSIVNQTICQGDSIFLQGKYVKTSGIYWDTLTTTPVNCNGIIRTNLTVINPNPILVKNQTLCLGDSIFLQGQFVKTTGTYYDTLTTSQFGCDSIIQTNLTVTPQNLTILFDTICNTDSVFLQGRFVSNSGTYFDTLTASGFGCDSIVQTKLTATLQNLTVLFDTICDTDSVFLQGQFVKTTGTYYDTLTTSQFGCDSIIQTNLTVTLQNLTVLFDTICNTDSVFLQGRFVSNSGTYFDTLTASGFGCDSIVQTKLTVTLQNLTVLFDTICDTDSVFLQGQFVKTTGTYYDTLTTSQFGCDSIIQTNLTVTLQNLTVLFDTICNTDSVFLQGRFVSNSGTYFDTLTASGFGCDSTILTYLYVVPPLDINLGNDTTLCANEILFITLNHSKAKYLWDNGSKSNSNTLKDGLNFVKVTQNGCLYYDSIIITTAPIPLINIGEDFKHCFTYSSTPIEVKNTFQSYLWSTGETTKSISIIKEGIYKVEVTSNFGCVGEDIISVENECPFNIFVPNTFTPNNDGINDHFFISGDNVTISSWKIFNRWGEIIFEGNSISDYWNGNFMGKKVMDGTYTYIIYYTDDNSISSVYQKIGHISLLR